MSQRTVLAGWLALTVAAATACGGTGGDPTATAPGGSRTSTAPAGAVAAGAAGSPAPAPRPDVITPDMIRADSPYLFHAYVKVDDDGHGFRDVSDEWYGPGNRAFRAEVLPLSGGPPPEGPYVYAGDGNAIAQGRVRLTGSRDFIRANTFPFWMAGRLGATVLDAMTATDPAALQELHSTPGWSVEPRSSGFVIHLQWQFSDYGDTSPVEIAVVDAVTLDDARQRGLFDHGLAPSGGVKAEIEPGQNPGRVRAWWLGRRAGGHDAAFAEYQKLDHPTDDDEEASVYTVVYLDDRGRQRDAERRAESWPVLPDDGRVDGSVVVRTEDHPRGGRCYPGQGGRLETMTLSDTTPVLVAIEGSSPAGAGRLCAAAADWKLDITAPGASEGDLRSMVPKLVPVGS